MNGWKKSMTDKNVVNTFAPTSVGWALIGAMKMLNRIGKAVLNEQSIQAGRIFTNGKGEETCGNM